MRTVLAAMLAAVVVSAQQAPPATEVYLAPFPVKAGAVLDYVNISNSPGYDNQPSFLPDSSAVLFASNRDGKQTDIYRYDIATKQLKQLTTTPEAEYSPTVTPDRKTFSAVRVEADKTQRLWRFNLDGSNPRLVLESVKGIGYHAWIDETHLALFVLGGSNSLQIASTKTDSAEVVIPSIGRMLLIRPKTGTITFSATGEPPVVNELDQKTGKVTTLVGRYQASQDAAWTPDGRLIMAKGSTVAVWTPGAKDWEDLATVGNQGPGNITRLAVSPDGKWLAFVSDQR